MLIFSQDRTMLLNMDSGIYAIEAKERRVVAMQLEPKLMAACTECALAAVLTRKEVLSHG